MPRQETNKGRSPGKTCAELDVTRQSLEREISERQRAEDALRRSEKRFRQFFENSPDAIFVEDADGRVLDANAAACRLHGLTRRELIGASVLDLIPPSHREEAAREFPRLIAGDLKRFTGFSLGAGGVTVPVEITVSRIDFENRTVVLLHVRDVTDRLKAESALRESEERYRTLVESVPIPILVVKEGRFVFANAAVATLLKYASPADVLGRLATDLVAPEYRDAIRKRIEALKTSRSNPRLELRMLAKDGSKPMIESSSFAIQLAGEAAVLVIGYDMTERIHADEERRLLESQVQHAQKLESLGVLAGGIAHDFNNILMAILGNAELALQDLPANLPARTCLEGIERAARRAAEMCRQMQTYAGRGPFTLEPLNLAALVEEMAHILELSISKKARIQYDFSSDAPPIEGDASQIRQVVMNLIINASEALGDREGIISLSTGSMECSTVKLSNAIAGETLPAGQYVTLQVADNGCGMNTVTQERIFDPFFSTKLPGRGLGLATVMGIIKTHHGAIEVCSEPGRGSTITVYFPVVNAASPVSAPPSPRDNKGWRGKGTILFVDDEEEVRTLGMRMLEMIGFRVLTAADGRAAVETFSARSGEIDCVLMDLSMPHLDGIEALRQIRKIRSDVKVVLSSGYNEPDILDQFEHAGSHAFIPKPYTLEQLRQTLRAVFSSAPSP